MEGIGCLAQEGMGVLGLLRIRSGRPVSSLSGVYSLSLFVGGHSVAQVCVRTLMRGRNSAWRVECGSTPAALPPGIETATVCGRERGRSALI